MNTDNTSTTQSMNAAQEHYMRLIHAIVEAGFRVAPHTSQSVTLQSMGYDLLVIDVESGFDTSGQHLFTVVYKPVRDQFYIASSKDISFKLGEVQQVPEDDDSTLAYFTSFRELLFPTTSLYLKGDQTTQSPV